MAEIKFEDLLGSGAHFGHVTRKWNPNFSPYIISEKNGVHIIDLESTIKAVNEAAAYVKKVVSKDGEILFVVQKSKLGILFSKKLIDVQCFILLKDG